MSDRMTPERLGKIRADIGCNKIVAWSVSRDLLAELDAVRGELAMALESYRREEAENESLHASLDAVTRERDEARKERDEALVEANRADMRADELAHQLAIMSVDSGSIGPQADPDELRFLNEP